MPAKLRTGPEYLLAALTRQKIFWFIIFHRGAGILPAAAASRMSALPALFILAPSPRGDTIWIMESIPRSIITRFNGSETQASAYSHHHRQNHTDNHLFHIIHSPYFRVLFTQLLP
jgi:hypothetical protein